MTTQSEPRPRRALVAVLLTLLHPLAGLMYVGYGPLGLGLTLGVLGASFASLYLAARLDSHLMLALVANTVVSVLWYAGSAAFAASQARKLAMNFTKRWYNRYGAYAIVLVLAGALWITNPLRSHVVQTLRTPANSMLPAIRPGDVVVVGKLAADRAPKRGDIIAFWNPLDGDDLMFKRVIALPGETLEMHNAALHIDGKALAQAPLGEREYSVNDDGVWVQVKLQTYSEQDALDTPNGASHVIVREQRPSPMGNDFGRVTIPPGTYFVLGDNRDHSTDSRNFGPVAEENIVGRMRDVLWSFAVPKQVPTP